jgi:hypothetical protein
MAITASCKVGRRRRGHHEAVLDAVELVDDLAVGVVDSEVWASSAER